ncbi:MAG: ComF family protein [Atopobiaceae bacterium]|nr:ComF family protein [Atopobiaceae bacterium]MDO4403885.1 ComF family protein [Atopobiaceae bacterium]
MEETAYESGSAMSLLAWCTAMRDAAQELLWPTRCVCCDYPGELLCESCRKSLPWIEQRWACPVCGAPFGSLICTECKKDWPSRSCVCALPFRGPAAQMVTCLKDSHELRLAPVIAAAMATALDEASAWPVTDGTLRYDTSSLDALCYVPATRKAFNRRGFDHMELVSHELAWLTSLPVADVLVRDTGKDQRSLGREDRQANLRHAIDVVGDVSGLDLLLVDDVITTGASVCACTEALLEKGAHSVSICALARVW